METDVQYKESFVPSDPNYQCADICNNDPGKVVVRPPREIDKDDPVVH